MFLRLNLDYGLCCNDGCTRNMIVFLEIDDDLEKYVRKIAKTCWRPSIEVYDKCTEEQALYICDIIDGLDNSNVSSRIVRIDGEKRKIIIDTAAIASPPPSMSWYSDNNVSKRYPDFYFKVLCS